MGIQLLSVSHKVAPLEIRSYFAFDEEVQMQIMLRLKEQENIRETVIIATCNRTEVYVYSMDDSDEREVFAWMRSVILEEAGASQIENIGDYIRLYQGEGAVHHIFRVAAGLDSMVIGEDQILGQVKRAHEYAHMHHLCGSYLNTLFRMAVTSAKKVKTDTDLSKTSVSTAGLALKAAEHELGSLKGKKLMVIGATGKIGGIVLKNASSMDGVELYVTMRTHSLAEVSGCHRKYQVIPYEERYQAADEMDVIVSATASPHYTLTRQRIQKALATQKKRVFVDLAVPMDIEESIGELPQTVYYNIEDFKHLAKKNNEKKKAEAEAAGLILEDYEAQFYKWMIFQNGIQDMERIRNNIRDRAEKKGVDSAVEKLFYDMREECSVEELKSFFGVISRL